MKFKDIKVGDTVFVEETVSYDYRRHETFLIPKPVERIMPTQFLVDNRKYFKKDGSGVGSHCYAYLEGDKSNRGNRSVVMDQTEQMEVFIQTIDLKSKVRDKIESLKFDKNTTKSLDELNEILALVEQLETKLK